MGASDCAADTSPADFKKMPSRRRSRGLTVDDQDLQMRERLRQTARHGPSAYHIRFIFAPDESSIPKQNATEDCPRWRFN
jgi:hypothetical protein